MESAAQGKVEQQFGDTVIPAEPPDWRDVERQASALMQRTKDLRVAVLLCRAWTILHGLPGTLQGLQLCGALLERHWEHVHPLPEDGDRSEEHTSELQSPCNLVCRLLLEKKKK